MKSYDVIIIGAGPAGLKCAETLGKSNLKVLVVEKKAVIGPKTCGGLLTSKAINYLNQNIGENKFKQFIVHSVFGKTKINITNSPLYTINRKKLGQSQLNKLRQFNNITIKKRTFVSKINKNYIIANNKKIGFKYLVGADGSSSLVRGYLGLKTNKLGIGIHYLMPREKYKNIELFFNAKFFNAWYAWILPHDNYVSIGAGCDLKILSGKKLIDNFHQWLKQKNIDVSGSKYEAHILNYDYQGVCFGKIFLIGDAAGLISGFTGEGIYPALVSGEEVAKKIINKKYKLLLADILKKKKEQDFISSMLIKMSFLRPIGHELIVWLLKNRTFRKTAIKLFA